MTRTRQVLELQAQAIDNQINTEFLQTLVLRYAKAERCLNELNTLKNRFLGMAAHDMRSPLGSIMGMLDLIRVGGGNLTEEQQMLLHQANNTAARMLALLDDLLDISVIESGQMNMRWEWLSLQPLIQDRINLHRVVAELKGIQVLGQAQEITPIRHDPARIGQVLDNLLSNAIKFTPFDGRVWIHMEENADAVVVSVTDSGPGLTEKDMQKAFADFQKLSAKPTGGEKSTGLGLAICRRIIEAHRGRIWVENESGMGACFKFSLPKG